MPQNQEYRPDTISEHIWRSIPAQARSAIIKAIEAAELRANAAEEQLAQANNAYSVAISETQELKAQLAAFETTDTAVAAKTARQTHTEEATTLETTDADLYSQDNTTEELIFHSSHHELVGELRVLEESSVWKTADMYRRLDRPDGFVLQDVALFFKDDKEYEVSVSNCDNRDIYFRVSVAPAPHKPS